MLIRIFAVGETGLDKYLNFLRLEKGGGRSWELEHCDPVTWIPSKPADIHIHVGLPLRLAIPWAKFNAFVVSDAASGWAAKEMDHTLTVASVTERATALKAFRTMFAVALRKQHPPMLPVPPVSGAMPPKVAIITPTRNRKHWWLNMANNVMRQSWPVSHIEWIIVDDGDDGQRLAADVDEFMEKSPGITLRYVEVTTGQKSIGYKRNAAVEAASDDTDVFVCMDDDDYYPKDSISSRVAWLTREKAQSQIAYCSSIPMYDLKRYISAIHVSDLDLEPAERVSEATLAFTRAAWVERSFPDVSVAEGVGFVTGREGSTVEIPSKDVIVSFIHTGNPSSRRIPKDQDPNGCHYGFPNDYFTYLHKVGGGMVEEVEVVKEVKEVKEEMKTESDGSKLDE